MSANTRVFESIDPYTTEVIGTTLAMSDSELDQALARATRTAAQWAHSGADERRALLRALARHLENDRDRLAGLITAEMGKLLSESRAEIDKCAWVCRYYADTAAKGLADEVIASDAARSFVAYQPLGVVLAVMPWNFPFWQVFRFAAPAIAAGNAGLLKHASNVSLCGAAIAALFDEAGAPPGLLTYLPIGSDRVADLLGDDRVQAATLTGSGAAGAAVAAAAGAACKKCVLELGGSDPFVVLDDADLEQAVAKGIKSRFMNAGQSCIAAKRFIVLESIADDFEQRFVEAAMALQAGDPRDDATTLAPMARGDLRDEIHQQVHDSRASGARVLTGGEAGDGAGFFYLPTVLTQVGPGMRAYGEELFGPVASILRASDEAEALRLANDTPFGLGGSVWTQDAERGLRVARALDCGSAFVNELVKSDPRLPFGGIKASGFGRELAWHGLREFVNAKTVYLQ
jgi:succinate-semialdehyde dehydrogenase/glutarate-semialdehyde dehydrogenase